MVHAVQVEESVHKIRRLPGNRAIGMKKKMMMRRTNDDKYQTRARWSADNLHQYANCQNYNFFSLLLLIFYYYFFSIKRFYFLYYIIILTFVEVFSPLRFMYKKIKKKQILIYV